MTSDFPQVTAEAVHPTVRRFLKMIARPDLRVADRNLFRAQRLQLARDLPELVQLASLGNAWQIMPRLSSLGLVTRSFITCSCSAHCSSMHSVMGG